MLEMYVHALLIYGRAWVAFERKGGRLGSHGGGFRAEEAGEDHGTVGLTHGTGASPFRCVSLVYIVV